MQILQILAANAAKIVVPGTPADVVKLDWIARIIRAIIEGVGSVGVGIILFSLVLKAIVLPFDIYQRVSMTKQNAKMKENQAKMEKLQKQYANDKAVYNQKLMEMYKENGISMFSSCLPAILSIVIFIVAINSFNAYSRYAMVNNYNDLVEAYRGEVFSYTAEIKEENIVTGNYKDGSYEIATDGTGGYYLVIDGDNNHFVTMAAAREKENGAFKEYATTEEKIAYIESKEKEFFVDADKYNASKSVAFSADECANAIKKSAQDRVKTEYENSVSGGMKFLWIKNIWETDATFKHPMQSYSDFKKSAFTASGCGKADDSSIFTPYTETDYETVTLELKDYKSKANGYYILIALSIGTILLQQFITMRSQKEQQKFSSADGTGAANQKMMMVVMTVMFAIFAFMYSSAFSIYMITSNIVSMIMTLVINKLVAVAMSKQEEKKMQEKYNNRFPGRSYKNDKDKKKK